MPSLQVSFDYDNNYPGPAFPVAVLTLVSRETGQEQQVTGYLDSGADGTLIPTRILQQIRARVVDEGWARTVSGQRYPVRLYAVNIRIGSHTIYGVDVVANERTNEVIVGRDLLNQLVVTLNGLAEITEITN